MRRRYTIGRFLDKVEQVRGALDRPAFTTDVIVGFPGETEADFLSTCRACSQAGFSKIHIFPFSPRRGTAAAEMPLQVASRLTDERHRRLAELEKELARRYYRCLLGRRLQVLVEARTPGPGSVAGTACRYVPVQLAGSSDLAGELIDVCAESLGAGGILARETHAAALGAPS